MQRRVPWWLLAIALAGCEDAAPDRPDAAAADAAPQDAGSEDAAGPDLGAADLGPADAGQRFGLTVRTSTGGAVRIAPPGLDCALAESPCVTELPAGTTVTLTASAAARFAFDGWAGDCAGQGEAANVLLDRDRACAARFLGLEGAVALVPPPVSVVPNTTEDPVDILVFAERTGWTVPAGVPFDLHVPDTYADYPLDAGDLPVGLEVDVYFLHFDPVGQARTDRQAELRFPGRVLALLTRSETLDRTDAQLGLPDRVTYPDPGGHRFRGLEGGGEDVLVLSPDRRTLTLDFDTSTSSDQLRIVVLRPGAPVPAFASRNVRLGPPPTSVALGSTESSTTVTGFVERAGPLPAPVPVDVSVPGTYTRPADRTPAELPAGTPVESVLLHLDPVGGASAILQGSLVLDRAILGLVVESPSLDASDGPAGAPGVAYPTGAEPDRGLEAGGDQVTLSGDRRSLRFQLRATTGSDQIRILLAD